MANGSDAAHLLQHGAYEVDRLQELQVDVHVKGHLPPLLQLLLLWCLILVPAVRRITHSSTCISSKPVKMSRDMQNSLCMP